VGRGWSGWTLAVYVTVGLHVAVDLTEVFLGVCFTLEVDMLVAFAVEGGFELMLLPLEVMNAVELGMSASAEEFTTTTLELLEPDEGGAARTTTEESEMRTIARLE